jgi:hypothetical protein
MPQCLLTGQFKKSRHKGFGVFYSSFVHGPIAPYFLHDCGAGRGGGGSTARQHPAGGPRQRFLTHSGGWAETQTPSDYEFTLSTMLLLRCIYLLFRTWLFFLYNKNTCLTHFPFATVHCASGYPVSQAVILAEDEHLQYSAAL